MAVSNVIIRACLYYEFKFVTAEACHKLCTAFGKFTVDEPKGQKWFKKFSSADENLEDKPRSVALSTTTISSWRSSRIQIGHVKLLP